MIVYGVDVLRHSKSLQDLHTDTRLFITKKERDKYRKYLMNTPTRASKIHLLTNFVLYVKERKDNV